MKGKTLTLPSDFKAFLGTDGHADQLLGAKKESDCVKVFCKFLHQQFADAHFYSAHSVLKGISDLSKDHRHSQFCSEFGEHDVALIADGQKTPHSVYEIKFAKKSSGGTVHVPQPFCLFLNDILFLALLRAHCGHAANDIRSFAALCFVTNDVYRYVKEDATNPWPHYFPVSDNDDELTATFTIDPFHAQPNAAKGNREWPNFDKPETLRRTHISKILSGGTNAKLLGTFLRKQFQLKLEAGTYVFEISRNDNEWTAIFAWPKQLTATMQDGTEVSQLEKILKLLP